MIINIRGTSGSGKSTLVRNVLDLYKTRQPIYVPGRKRPICYRLWRDAGVVPHDRPELVVLGHYDTACGGCDTIPTTQETFDLALEAHYMGADVLYEGLLISSDFKHTLELARNVGFSRLAVVELSTSLEECLASVNTRRAARDATLPPVNPKNTASKHKGVRSSSQKLLEHGVQVWSVDRASALEKVGELLSGSLL